MKSTFLSLAISASGVAAGRFSTFVDGPQGWPQAIGLNTTQVADHGSLFVDTEVKKRDTAAPNRVQLTPRLPHIPNSKSTKLRYGPYTVPGAWVPGGEGMIENRPNPSIDKPCQDCMILGMNAGLEYQNGADANTDTLMWLHHMVMFNIGTGAWDATCTVFGAPHLIVGSMPSSSERIFSSGNERTTTFFNPPWANVKNLGYPVYKADRFGLIVDLMNMNTASKSVYLTIYYDYIDGHPAHFEEVKPVWMDAFQCMTSEISGRTPGAKFDFAAPAWISNFEGEVMGAGGHLHDGGTKLDVMVDGRVICSSVPTYGTDEQALVRANAAKTGDIAPLPVAGGGHSGMSMPKMPGMGGHAGGQHIIAMSICADNKAGVKNLPISPLGITKLNKGQSWTLKAYYDYNEHAGMKKGNSGTMSTVMGISIMYAKTKNKRAAGAGGGMFGGLFGRDVGQLPAVY